MQHRFSLLRSGAVLALLSTASAQTFANHFQRGYDPLTNSFVSSIKQTADTGYIYVGSHSAIAFPVSTSKPLLVKLRSDFSVEWSVTFGFPGEDQNPPTSLAPEMTAVDVIQTRDRGFVICGSYLFETAGGNRVAYMLKTDSVGQVQWFQTYPDIETLNSVVEATRGRTVLGLMACGVAPTATNDLGAILRTDPLGNAILATRTWGLKNGATYSGSYAQIIPYLDGTFALVGTLALGFPAPDMDVMVTITDDQCNLLRHLAYGRDVVVYNQRPFGVSEWGTSLVREGEDLVVVGAFVEKCIQNCLPNLADDMLMFRLDGSGNLRWAQRYDFEGDIDRGRHVITSDYRGLRRRLTVTGGARTSAFQVGRSEDLFSLEAALQDGSVLGCEVFGGRGTERGESLLQNLDGHVLLLGNTDSFGTTYPQNYLIERYQSIARRCADVAVEVQSTKIPLPIHKPFAITQREAHHAGRMLAKSTPVDPQRICPKVVVRR